MDRAVVQHRIKQPVKRTNIVVKIPKTIQVVVKPSVVKIVDLQQLSQNELKQVKISQQTKLPPSVVKQSETKIAISKPRIQKRELKTKKTNIQYVTREASPESLIKIRGIQNKGLGRILAIIGNGPSIAEVPLEKLKNLSHVDILSINSPDSRVWPTSHWAFFDRSQLRRHESLWNSYNGILFNSTAIKEQLPNSMQFKNLSGVGFSRDMIKGLYIGRSSVFASMQIAMWMNYNHIYIFGCDMNPDGLDGKLHFYGVNPDVAPNLRGQRFEKEAKSYDFAADNLDDSERAKFTFCTEYNPWQFVDKFNRMNHKIAVDYIREHNSRMNNGS